MPSRSHLSFRGWFALAVVLWGAVLVGAFVRSLIRPNEANIGIYRVYAEAGRNWLAGVPIYDEHDNWVVFPYSPVVATPFVFLSQLPDALGSAFWRLTVGVVYLLALERWIRIALPRDLGERRYLLGLLVLPLAATTILAGQMGGLVAATILIGITAAVEERWTLAAVALVAACLLKIYPVSLALLLAACYLRPFAGRFVLIGILGALTPFLFQSPDYVIGQYEGWFHMLHSSDRLYWPLDIANRNLTLLFRVWIMPPTHAGHIASQLLAALVAAVLCVLHRRALAPASPDCFEAGRFGGPASAGECWGMANGSLRRIALTVLGLAGCWMTLFGPVVESYTYILLGPSLAWALIESWRVPRSPLYRGTLILSWSIFTLASAAVWFGHSIALHRLGPHPFAGLLFCICLVWDAIGEITHSVRSVPVPEESAEYAETSGSPALQPALRSSEPRVASGAATSRP
jgi:Glycosyltransferase family 87